MPSAGERGTAKVLADLERGRVPPLLVTRYDTESGEDLYARDRLLRAVRTAVLGESSPVFGETLLEAPTITLIEILDAAREVSLLAPRRLVLVRGSRVASGEGSEETTAEDETGAGSEPGPSTKTGGDSAHLAALDRYLATVRETACILFLGCPWDARRRIHKALLEASVVVDLSRPDLARVPAWIEEEMGRAGVRLNDDAVGALAELCGSDTLRLSNEIAKLALHSEGERAVTREQVLSLVGAGAAPSAWSLVDAIAEGDAERAVSILERLLDDAEPAPVIVGAIASRLRQLVVLRDEQSAGKRNDAARGIVFPGRSIYFADSVARRARKFGGRALTEALARLYDVDRAVKSSPIDGGALLVRWVVDTLRSSDSVQNS